jgi:hypothetical protein
MVAKKFRLRHRRRPTSASYFNDPVSARAMDKQDIKIPPPIGLPPINSKTAGYGLIYVYAGHGIGDFRQNSSPAPMISRADEYGGSLANRAGFA